jgi:hypothetical protein
MRVFKAMRMRSTSHVTHKGRRRIVFRILVRDPERKRAFERPRHG